MLAGRHTPSLLDGTRRACWWRIGAGCACRAHGQARLRLCRSRCRLRLGEALAIPLLISEGLQFLCFSREEPGRPFKAGAFSRRSGGGRAKIDGRQRERQ